MKTLNLIAVCVLLSATFLPAQKPVPKGAYQLLAAQYGEPHPITAEERGFKSYKIFMDGYWLGVAGKRGGGKPEYANGGTYTFENGKYHEFIDFASWDSTLAGADILFDYSAEGAFYHQTGAFPNGDVIDEVQLRVSPSEDLKDDRLEGAWLLERATWGDLRFDPEKNAGEVVVKIYAYPVMAYGFWNKKTGSFIGAGVGRYQFDGKILTEKIEFSTWDEPGTQFSINVSMGENTYEQHWQGNTEKWRKTQIKPRKSG